MNRSQLLHKGIGRCVQKDVNIPLSHHCVRNIPSASSYADWTIHTASRDIKLRLTLLTTWSPMFTINHVTFTTNQENRQWLTEHVFTATNVYTLSYIIPSLHTAQCRIHRLNRTHFTLNSRA